MLCVHVETFVYWLDVSNSSSCPPLTTQSDRGCAAAQWRSMFPLPVCQCWSITVCGSGLWPAADKRVAMRRRACWACCTPNISMASHAPPLHQPLCSTVSVLLKKLASSSTAHTLLVFILAANEVNDLSNASQMRGLFFPLCPYLNVFFFSSCRADG